MITRKEEKTSSSRSKKSCLKKERRGGGSTPIQKEETLFDIGLEGASERCLDVGACEGAGKKGYTRKGP